MIEIKTFDPDETVKIGRKLGGLLKKGDVVCLAGDLGSGKTSLTKGIAAALGIKEHVTSPTFTIVNEYKGKVPFYHFDVYRISHPEEMYEIGFEEYIGGSGITVIEWADLIRELLPCERIWIDIRKDCLEERDGRSISIRFIGDRYKGYERQLKGTEKHENTCS
ncbi:MAG: tRNA (adenosine(37)-N6)-threonylcarbamoyltransferase complex ATPase subunit type 1 TsaE [Clostridiales bacterium]|jgi:tRNA threonylcarbamoyladenosine biosynthesis protein TsaE|nr:tRNA (adenosine(37)-N6)-threonylcarbamoyltransferase complex ATPase subunit type 1 TsaE [Eubacteriales bacterium]MDH7566920.1 tRNA (adenosine(37)-N6)-threonylcarbamoyltransferase complex ATPase subunit type 1 TsaE [Clostridiales bacterium]